MSASSASGRRPEAASSSPFVPSVAHVQQGYPKPCSRGGVSQSRLDARDRWNSYEIRIQEIFLRYDRDNSGALEQEEFRQLLCDFNDGKWPTDQEYTFMMRISDTDHNGKITLGELHYALQAWHSYRNLDDSVLRLFAEFDLDQSGRIDFSELRGLLIEMNDGKPVSSEEVQQVMQRADLLGDGVISRCELLGAIAAWYSHIDRQSSDIPSLMREAMARTVKDHNTAEIFSSGTRNMGQAQSHLSGLMGGYAQVGEDVDRNAPLASSPLTGEGPPPDEFGGPPGSGGDKSVQERLKVAAPYIFKSFGAFAYLICPAVFNLLMIYVGWTQSDNDCPHNLDGILVWYGMLGLVFIGLVLFEKPQGRIRIAVGVMLITLNLVGGLWTFSNAVLEKGWTACGHFLILWSRMVWIGIPLVTAGTLFYMLAAQIRMLTKQDAMVQSGGHSIVL